MESLTPIFTVDTDAIIRDWYEEWEETEESHVEEWALVAHPLLPDNKLALIFEYTITVDDFDEDGNILIIPIANHYRILIYDIVTGKIIRKCRFNIFKGVVKTVYEKDGSLFAVTTGIYEDIFHAVQISPLKLENQLCLGENVADVCPLRDGSLLVSYGEEGKRMSLFSDEGEEKTLYMTEVGIVTKITLDSSGLMWGVMSNKKEVMTWGNEPMMITELGHDEVLTVAVPDGDGLFVFCEDDGRLTKINSLEPDTYFEITSCSLTTDDGCLDRFDYATGYEALLALRKDGTIYVVNLNS